MTLYILLTTFDDDALQEGMRCSASLFRPVITERVLKGMREHNPPAFSSLDTPDTLTARERYCAGWS